MRVYKGVVRSAFNEVHLAVLDIVELLKTKCGIDDRELLFKINFTLREVMNNAVEHGNAFDESKKITCEVFKENDTLIFEVEDEGEGIDFEANPFNVDKEYVLRERNRGIQVIQDLDFRVSINGNRIRLELDV